MTIQKCPRYRFDNKKTFKERRIVIKRSWVRIPAPDTGWKIFTLICCKNGIVCLKRPKINKKEAGHGHFFEKNTIERFCWEFFRLGGAKSWLKGEERIWCFNNKTQLNLILWIDWNAKRLLLPIYDPRKNVSFWWPVVHLIGTVMDHRIFWFATRGQCIKGKQCNLKQNMCLCSKQSSLFSFYALPSGSKSKEAVVHYSCKIRL